MCGFCVYMYVCVCGLIHIFCVLLCTCVSPILHIYSLLHSPKTKYDITVILSIHPKLHLVKLFSKVTPKQEKYV